MKFQIKYCLLSLFLVISLFSANNLKAEIIWNFPIRELSDPTGVATKHQIITDCSGKYVHAIWRWLDPISTNELIQRATSSDYGATWSDDTNISEIGYDADSPQITSNSTGEYIYATWKRPNGTNDAIQTAISTDYGVTWSLAIDRSEIGDNCIDPQILTDNTGQYVFLIWVGNNGGDDTVRLIFSSDYGSTWGQYLDLSESTGPGNASSPKIAIDNIGRTANVIWNQNDKTYQLFILNIF